MTLLITLYSLRTAGDLVQNVEPGVREMGLQILQDEGYSLAMFEKI